MITAVRTVYYGDKVELLRDCLVPLARELSEGPTVTSAWLQTRWKHGPHVVLFVDGDPENAEVTTRRVTERVATYLEKHPSHERIDAERYERTSHQLGRLELVEGPYLPLMPDNSVTPTHDTVVDTFVRTDRAAAAKGRIMTAGMTAIDETIASTPVLDAVVAGMTALATAYPRWGLVSGYQALLSHWKEYFFWADADGSLEDRLARSYDAQRDALVARVGAAHTGGIGARAADPVLDVWAGWVEASLPVALTLAQDGEVLPYPHPSRLVRAAKFGEQTAVQWSGSDERDYSDFHREFRKLDFTRLGNGTDFAAYRFLVNCFFELLPVLGVTPIQRYAVAYLFTRAAQDVVGETWQETVARAIERQQAAAEIVPTLPWRGGHDA